MRWKRSTLPPCAQPSGKNSIYHAGRLYSKNVSEVSEKGIPCVDLRYFKGQHFLWMVYERVILSVKKTNSESNGKFRRRVGGLKPPHVKLPSDFS